MQKVYLLLRNNRQSGPFTIDELWQQQLRSTDMVWIEGKSTAWAYLSELELLPSAETSSSTPPASGEIERKAEELRRRALNTAPHHHHLRNLPEEYGWEPSEQKEEEASIDFIDHRKEKNNVVSELLMTVLIIALFAGGLYGGRTFFMEKKSATSPVANKLESTDRHEAVQANRIQSAATEPLASQDSVRTDSVMKDSALLLSLEKPRTVLNKKSPKEGFVKHDSMPPLVNPSEKTDDAGPNLNQLQSSADIQPQSTADDNSKKDSTSTGPAVKKKTFGQALRGLFHKKKKEEENPSDSSSVRS
ncbi:MAG: hypothetical protein ACJ75B_19775 [Flavisolibacter sp.]